MADVTAKCGDLLYHAGTQIHILRSRCQKNSFCAGVKLSVCQCHLKFILKVTDCPEPLDNGGCAGIFHIVCQQALGNIDRHIG